MTSKRALALAGLLASFAVAGCVSLATPEGYAERTRTGGYAYQAVSTDASIIAVEVYENEDPERGDLAYWTEAARKHMTLARGYALLEEGDFVSPQGPGHWMKFSKKHKGVDHLYLLGLVIDGDDIYAIEAGGETELFKDDVERVLAAFATLD